MTVTEVLAGPPLPAGQRIDLPGRGTTFVRSVDGPPGAPTVLIANMPAANMGSMCVCVGPPDSIIAGSPTALAAALVIPSATFTAFQSKNNARLVAGLPGDLHWSDEPAHVVRLPQPREGAR